MKKIIVYLLSIMFMASACASYKAPTVELPNNDQEEQTVEQGQETEKEEAAVIQDKWWEIFNDEVLNALEEEALEYNQDLKSAMAKIQEAKANLSVERSSLYPTINLFGRAADTKSNRRMYYDWGIDSGRFSVGVSASYELDLWGKYWKASKSSKADFLATKADYDAVKLTLTATVAQMYFQYMAYDAEFEITKNTLKLREDSYDVYSKKFQKGVINELDLRRVESEMESVRAQVYSAEQSLKKAESSLSILIGRSPKRIVEESVNKGNKINDSTEIPQVPTDIPSDLISRRPDIKASEYTLKSYNAKIGAAKAYLFPSISLTGEAGFASYELEDLFKEDKDTWSYSGEILWPIFSGGKNMKTFKAKKAQYEQALASYNETIQTAFKEVLDAINAYSLGENIVAARLKEVVALRRSYQLALKREKAGLIELLDVLDVERTLLEAEEYLVSAKQNQLNAVVNICKALGGGWKEK